MSDSKIVIYDLMQPNRNYDELYEYLKSFSEWAHISDSAWFILTDESCVTIRDEIMQIIDSNDTVFVAELNGAAAWHNLICDSDYLKENL